MLSVGPAWGPEPGRLGDERRKRISMIRAEGGLVNPYRSSLLESHIAALSGDPEPRRDRTRSLPHIRQVNAHVMEESIGPGSTTVKLRVTGYGLRVRNCLIRWECLGFGRAARGRFRRGLSPANRAGGYADRRLRGRPPLTPLAFAAAAFAFDRLCPPRRPVAAANRRLPNARSTRPGT